MLNNEGNRLTRVVVCSPKTEYFLVDDPAAHNIPEVADEHIAVEQHGALRSHLEGYGAEVIDVDELAGHPNSVFVRDAAISTPRGYIKVRMGIDTRLGEEGWMAEKLEALREPCIGEIRAPGTVEGGDVVVAGRVVFAGITQRTNVEGVEQLSKILADMDIEVRSVTLPDSYLHLDQTIGVVGPQRLMCCRGLFPGGFFDGFEIIESPCHQYNVNFICLGENEIIAPLANTEAVKIARDAGVRVRDVDVSEFAKGAGGPNCLVMPLERV
jgi:dimethylargininase